MAACCVCQEPHCSRDELEIHIATEHVHYAAFECEHCKTARFPTEYALTQHYVNDHRQRIFYVKYRVTPALEAKRKHVTILLNKSLKLSAALGHDQSSPSTTTSTTAGCSVLDDRTNAASFALRTYALEDESVPSGSLVGNKEPEPGSAFANTVNYAGKDDILEDSSQFQRLDDEFGGTSGLLEAIFAFKDNTDDRKQTGTSVENVNPRKRARKGSDAGENQVTCAGCGRQVANFPNCLMLHVSTHHCEDAIFECTGCEKKWYSLSARTKEHTQKVHDGDTSLIKDNRSSVVPTLKAKMRQLFNAR